MRAKTVNENMDFQREGDSKSVLKIGNTASMYKIDDPIYYNINGRKYKGHIADHFGDGVFIIFDEAVQAPFLDDSGILKSFEIYDDEEYDGVTMENLSKRY